MKLITSPSLRDTRYFALFVILTLLSQIIYAQQEKPIIKATSVKVDVKDGEIFQKAVWNLSPEVKPDIYFPLDPVSEKRITFYTDIDSISFNIVPGNIYNFIILLNNKDTCHTRISTIKPVKETGITIVSSALIDPEKLKHDFVLFREILEKEHAGLYRYKSKILLNKLFDSCFAALKHPMTQLEFGKTITYVISYLEDGHTGTNISRLLMSYYNENKKLFPVYVYFIHKKAYVLCSRIKYLPATTEILSIDNKPVSEIKSELFQYLPSDGAIETKKNQTLNNGAFSFLYTWIFGDRNSFIVKYKTQQGKIEVANINAEFVKDFECDNGKPFRNTKDLQLDFPQSNTALLTIKTFDDKRLGGNQNFREFLDTSFKEINLKGIGHLIIDLRGNTGGTDEYGALLYSYLANKPFKYFSAIESYKGKIKSIENPLLGLQQPQNCGFSGKVCFLINGLSFSTTADFCSIAKSNNRGKFIGEETGGGYYGNTSGRTVKVQLPNTKVEVIIPQYKYINDVVKAKYPNRGIIPDYTIIPTISDLIRHQDVQLNFALRFVNAK